MKHKASNPRALLIQHPKTSFSPLVSPIFLGASLHVSLLQFTWCLARLQWPLRASYVFLSNSAAYIGHFVTSSKAQYLESHGCFRSLLAYLADPLVLNVATLVIGGVCLLSIPVAMVDLPAPPLSPVSDRRLAAASCASHPPILYFLVFVHTISSGTFLLHLGRHIFFMVRV